LVPGGFYSPSPEHPAACCRDVWHGDPLKLEERRRVSFGEFRFDTLQLAAGSFINLNWCFKTPEIQDL
jgi:hypothetical protein